MIEHIVKNNESVESILNHYNISLEELKANNHHITDFNNLICGTKLLIPNLTSEVEQILNTTESFVMDYYPKISEELSKVEAVKTDSKVEAKPKNENQPSANINESKSRRAYPGILPPNRPYNGR